MRITLVSSLNLSGFAGTKGEPELDILVAPLGILTLAAVLRDKGQDADLVDLNFEVAQHGLALDESFYFRSAAIIAARQPDVVGFSTMCNSFHISLKIAQFVRELAPRAKILLGGPHVSYCDEETLAAFPCVDFVLRGEAEFSLPLLISTISADSAFESVPGLTWRRDGEIVRNAASDAVIELEALPFPAWELFPYRIEGGFSIDVGRGCPFACDFCSTSVFFQRKFRLKSFQRILDEANWLSEKFGARAFTFVHDLFTANRKWVAQFCRFLLERDGEAPFIWSASARIDTVDRELLELMHAAGCRALFFGIETGSQRLQTVIGKRLKVHTVLPVAAAAAEIGIEPTLSFILGFPLEEEEDAAETFDLISQLMNVDAVGIQLHLMSPQVGTADLARHGDALRLDTYYSDIAAGSSDFVDEAMFRAHPALFPSFYYYENPSLPRTLAAGADVFVRFVCNHMRATLTRLLERHSLWDIYKGWRDWARVDAVPARAGSQYDSAFAVNDAGRRIVSLDATTPDLVLMSFQQYVEEAFGPETGFDTPDEILAFFLRHYHQRDVFVRQ